MTNCSGQLIGVPSAGATVPSPEGGSSAGSVGLGFAIPVDLAKAISDEIIATGGNPTHGYFGIQVIAIPPAASKKSGKPEGLYVEGVVPGGPAAQAGLQQGDVITEINGEAATDPNQLQAITITQREGSTVQIKYVTPSGQTMTATVTLGTQPTS